MLALEHARSGLLWLQQELSVSGVTAKKRTNPKLRLAQELVEPQPRRLPNIGQRSATHYLAACSGQGIEYSSRGSIYRCLNKGAGHNSMSRLMLCLGLLGQKGLSAEKVRDL
jgi:hypothetical protein